MKFCAIPVEQFLHILSQGAFRPRHELTPMVLGPFPEDFDHVEFGAVGREVAKEGVALDHPAPSDIVVQAVMDAGVVQDDEGWRGLGDAGNQIVKEVDERFPAGRARGLSMVKLLAGKIMGAHHRDALMVRRCDRVWLSHRRPSPLHGRRRRESRLIVVEQLTPALASPFFEAGKFRLASGKSYGVSVFFRLNRVRLKLNPQARSLTLRVSSEHGSGQ